jgi:hypothetical protein
MVLQALRKASPSLEGLGGWKVELGALSKSNESTKGRKPEKEEHWTIEQLGQDSGTEELLNATSQLQVVSEKIQKMVLEMIPQISSRIQHAASSIFQELSRIHFVPFLTVAIACLGRIHCILLQMGREAVTCLKENKINFDVNVNHLFEVTHDELVNEMNGFVDNLRWRDAVSKFKLGQGLVESGDAKLKERTNNVSGDQYKSNNSFVKEYIGINDDTGEIFSTASKCFDQGHQTDVTNSCSAGAPLEHQASSNQRVYLDANSSASEKPKKKKKKKRKEKKERTSEVGIDGNSDGEDKDESANIQQEDAAETAKEEQGRISQDETFEHGSTCKDQQRGSSLWSLEVDSAKKKRKNKKKRKSDDIDSIFNDDLVSSKKQNSSALHPERDLITTKAKKAKKKKKTGSVIDDIFS